MIEGTGENPIECAFVSETYYPTVLSTSLGIFPTGRSRGRFMRRIGKTSGECNRRETAIFLAFAYTRTARSRGPTERATTLGELKPLPVITDAVANFSGRIRTAGSISLRE